MRPCRQGPVKVRVNCVSLVFGICVWVFIALLVLDAWRLVHSPDVSASGAAIVGFYPLFVLGFCGPLEPRRCHRGVLKGEGEAGEMEAQQAGKILNLSPYVIFFVIMFVGMIVEAFLS